MDKSFPNGGHGLPMHRPKNTLHIKFIYLQIEVESSLCRLSVCWGSLNHWPLPSTTWCRHLWLVVRTAQRWGRSRVLGRPPGRCRCRPEAAMPPPPLSALQISRLSPLQPQAIRLILTISCDEHARWHNRVIAIIQVISCVFTHLTFMVVVFSVFFFWCFHATRATMIRKTKLSSIVRITGEMNAQMKWVSGFRKHLQYYNYIVAKIKLIGGKSPMHSVFLILSRKLTPDCSHSMVLHREQILEEVSELPSRAEGCHNWLKWRLTCTSLSSWQTLARELHTGPLPPSASTWRRPGRSSEGAQQWPGSGWAHHQVTTDLFLPQIWSGLSQGWCTGWCGCSYACYAVTYNWSNQNWTPKQYIVLTSAEKMWWW